MKNINETDGVYVLNAQDMEGTTFSIPLLEVNLKNNDDFLKVVETLTRIGIVNHRDKILYQSCHILHKKGRYFLVHFKEMYAIDGRQVDLSDEDVLRRNYIAGLLAKWNLITIADKKTDAMCSSLVENETSEVRVFVLTHANKKNYQLKAKYNIGTKRKVAA